MNNHPERIPVRLCCGERHAGSQCLDGNVACALCYTRVPVSKLNVLPTGQREDVCKPCAADETEEICAACNTPRREHIGDEESCYGSTFEPSGRYLEPLRCLHDRAALGTPCPDCGTPDAPANP